MLWFFVLSRVRMELPSGSVMATLHTFPGPAPCAKKGPAQCTGPFSKVAEAQKASCERKAMVLKFWPILALGVVPKVPMRLS